MQRLPFRTARFNSLSLLPGLAARLVRFGYRNEDLAPVFGAGGAAEHGGILGAAFDLLDFLETEDEGGWPLLGGTVLLRVVGDGVGTFLESEVVGLGDFVVGGGRVESLAVPALPLLVALAGDGGLAAMQRDGTGFVGLVVPELFNIDLRDVPHLFIVIKQLTWTTITSQRSSHHSIAHSITNPREMYLPLTVCTVTVLGGAT